VPFGVSRPVQGLDHVWKNSSKVHIEPEEGYVHGYSSNARWTLTKQENEIIMECIYPPSHSVKKLRKILRASTTTASYAVILEIYPRKDVQLPIGLHPTFRLSSVNRQTQLIPGKFKFGLTFPGKLEPTSQFLPAQFITSLSAIPTISPKKFIDASHLPLEENTEELVQLCGIDGTFLLLNKEENYSVSLKWNPEHFPSLLLWISSRGRTEFPWNGNFSAIGVEPVHAAFDLGNNVSINENLINKKGVSTVQEFKAEKVWRTEYSFEVRETPGSKL